MAFSVSGFVPSQQQPNSAASSGWGVFGGTAPQKYKEPDGELIIGDHFYSSPRHPERTPHGEMVNDSALKQGFKGFVREDNVSDPTPPTGPDPYRELFKKDASRADVLHNIDSYAQEGPKGLLRGEIAEVDYGVSLKARHSVLNFSQGSSEASAVKELYGGPYVAFRHDEKDPRVLANAQNMLDNEARAFGLDADKMRSSDPKISGPERAKLQQALVDRVHGAVAGDSEIKELKHQYDARVHQFAKGNNSVVVSAGNEGDVLPVFAKDNGNRSLNLPKSFFASPLSNQDNTTVGATRWYQNGTDLKERVANYSTPGSDVSIYASGSLATDPKHPQVSKESGTSFSAPRVAAAMAGLHHAHPNMNHKQVEALLKQQLTHTLDTGHGEVSVLDYGKTLDFLSQQTY